MHVYRYRSSGLLSQKGLLYDEWYFASREELNDPIEMQSKFEFSDNSAETWWRISMKLWKDVEQANVISTYLARLSPISYEHLLKNFDKHKQKILNIMFKDKSIAFSELVEFRKNLDDLESVLLLNSPRSGYTISLSKTHTDMLMWSHYASSHQGYCIIYRPIGGYLYQCPKRKKESLEVSPGHQSVVGCGFKINDIHYSDQLNAIDAFTLLPEYLTGYAPLPESNRLNFHSESQNQLLTKNKCWDYEQECRLLLPEPKKWISGVSNYSNLKRLFHYDFSQVAGIIFGARMTEHEKNTIRDIVNFKLTERFSNLGASGEKKYLFDFLFQEAEICTSSRAVKIKDLELNSMSSILNPGSEYYERQLKKWNEFQDMTIEAGTSTFDPIP